MPSLILRTVSPVVLLFGLSGIVGAQGPCGAKPCKVEKTIEPATVASPRRNPKPIRPQPEKANIPAVGSLLVNSNAANATVTINNRDIGTTDGNGYFDPGPLKPGSYAVALAKPGYYAGRQNSTHSVERKDTLQPEKFYFREGIYNLVDATVSKELEGFSFLLFVFTEQAGRRVSGEVQYPSGNQFWSQQDRQYFPEYTKVTFTPRVFSRNRLRFSTKPVNGISYTFDGQTVGKAFLEGSDAVVVRGTLIKYRHGHKVLGGVFGFSFRPFVSED